MSRKWWLSLFLVWLRISSPHWAVWITCKAQQPVALTRVRVELRDVGRMDRQALNVAGVPGVMMLDDGVVHLITGLH
jgi:hypothetical protein